MASDVSTDLIELDSSLSFDVDDFDPLNQNAKQIPPAPKRSPVVIPPVPSSVPPSKSESFSNPLYPYHQSRVHAFSNPVYPYHQPPPVAHKIVVIFTLYHFLFRLNRKYNIKIFIHFQSSPVPSNYKEDENELLRKYGLDRLNLIDKETMNRSSLNDNNTPNPFAIGAGSGAISNRNSNRTTDPFLDNSTTNGMRIIGDIQPKTNNNWTKFD